MTARTQRRPGRPSKLTPEVKKKLLDLIRAGNYYSVACTAVGIDYATFRRWIEKAEQPGTPPEYREFRDDLMRAEAEAEAALVAIWRGHAPTSPGAVRDLLAKRYPERWGDGKQKVAVEITGGEGKPVEVKHEHRFSADHVADLARVLAELGAIPVPVGPGEGGDDADAEDDAVHPA